MSDRTAAIYLCQSLTPTDVSPHPLTVQACTLPHIQIVPNPFPIQLKCSFQTRAACLIYLYVSVNQLSLIGSTQEARAHMYVFRWLWQPDTYASVLPS